MKAYVTTKVVLAEPELEPSTVDFAPARAGYKVVYPDGYVSWCPKEVFERSSREVIATERSLIFQGIPPEPVVEDEPEDAEVATEE